MPCQPQAECPYRSAGCSVASRGFATRIVACGCQLTVPSPDASASENGVAALPTVAGARGSLHTSRSTTAPRRAVPVDSRLHRGLSPPRPRGSDGLGEKHRWGVTDASTQQTLPPRRPTRHRRRPGRLSCHRRRPPRLGRRRPRRRRRPPRLGRRRPRLCYYCWYALRPPCTPKPKGHSAPSRRAPRPLSHRSPCPQTHKYLPASSASSSGPSARKARLHPRHRTPAAEPPRPPSSRPQAVPFGARCACPRPAPTARRMAGGDAGGPRLGLGAGCPNLG
eukprot:scaffold23201_cov108-Isochrysis_galbana.AAC.4